MLLSGSNNPHLSHHRLHQMKLVPMELKNIFHLSNGKWYKFICQDDEDCYNHFEMMFNLYYINGKNIKDQLKSISH